MNFSIAIMLSKAVQAGVKALIGILLGIVSTDTLLKFGIQIDANTLVVALSALAISGLEALRNYLKIKFRIGWL